MEIKTASLTADEARRASTAHYDVENQIMDHVRGMTLAGKRTLAMKMSDHVNDAEKEAKAA
jgi:hypothetical protein